MLPANTSLRVYMSRHFSDVFSVTCKFSNIYYTIINFVKLTEVKLTRQTMNGCIMKEDIVSITVEGAFGI